MTKVAKERPGADAVFAAIAEGGTVSDGAARTTAGWLAEAGEGGPEVT